LIGLLARVFQTVDGPVLLDDVVTWISEARGTNVADPSREISRPLDDLPADGNNQHDVLNAIAQRAQLKELWTEICRLPMRHRAALLLNLRDKNGGDTLPLLPILGVVTIHDIGEVLGFSPEDFASVWNQLPWDDNRVAEHLELTRQQVINLRQSARARLARYLRRT
jgi:hypothetical protein